MLYYFYMLKHLIFDLDGVLLDSIKFHLYSWQKAFAEIGLYPTKIELGLLEGHSYEGVIHSIVQHYHRRLTKKQKQKIAFLKQEILKERKFYPQPYKGVIPALKFFHQQGIEMGVVTGASRAFTQPLIEKNFSSLFSCVITGDDTRCGKPSPQPYLLAKKRLKAKEENSLVIENAPCGIQSAHRAGFSVFALPSTLPPFYLQAAEKIFPSHRALFFYLLHLITYQKYGKAN